MLNIMCEERVTLDPTNEKARLWLSGRRSYGTKPDRRQVKSYFDCLADRTQLKGAKFGLPMKRFWETAPLPQRKVVERVLRLIRRAGAEIFEVDMPCAEERLREDGEWDW